MPDYARPLREYAKALSANLARGDATEHTHRPALKALIETLWPETVATNEPRRINAGAPDYIVSMGSVNVGYIEAKDIGKNLREIERSEQLKRYLPSLPNLILTDYVEFRWYTDGELRQTASLAMVKDNAVKPSAESMAEVHGLLCNFMRHRAPAVSSPKELAQRMAHLARLIHDVTVQTFAQEADTGTLHAEYEAFKEVLLPELTSDQFADMFAQTIAYGLFAARESKPTGQDFTRQTAGYMLPRTNPFLRKLFGHIAGPDLDDRIVWIVDDLARLLSGPEIDDILGEFQRRTRQEDPVVHFYETFLAEYDPKMREVRGVYYTPEPVVSYIVRSVDHLLRTKFDKPMGLADENVLILDPACGTGTFLFHVVKFIHQRLVEQGQAGGWNDYVEKHLLPRLFGFELLVAPYTIAHLKMGMLLEQLGYEFKSDQRLGIYLTNTLEEAVTKQEVLGFAGFITEEANAAAEIKREKPIMVVLGNPPYSGHSANKGPWIDGLLKGKLPDGTKVSSYYEVDGQPLGERNPKWLQDDYVKFIRFGQWRIDQTGYGILGFVTNHGYLDNPTFRGMRQSLMHSFTEISVLDLHGNSKKKETAPDGRPDQNVFDIQQGVAIGLFVKEEGKRSHATVRHSDLWGVREKKYEALCEGDIERTEWHAVAPRSPFYLYVPQSSDLLDEYQGCWSIQEAVPVNVLGFQTHRDEFAVDFDKAVLRTRIAEMRRSPAQGGLTDEEFAEQYRVRDNRDWKLRQMRRVLREDASWEDTLTECLYRPFDWRFCYFSEIAMDYPRRELVQHVAAKDNLCLLVPRQINLLEWRHALVTKDVAESCAISTRTREQNYVLPLYVYPGNDRTSPAKLIDIDEWPLSEKGRRPNLNPDFVADFEKRLGMKFITEGKGDRRATFGPEDVFDYIYAVFHSPTYRTRYAEFLKRDFPRVPLTSDPQLFRGLTEKGEELVSLHLMESPALNSLVTTYPVSGSDEVEKVRYEGTSPPAPLRTQRGESAAGRVYINKDQYFEGIGQEVWEFHIGGYQVLEKWLKDRKGRRLTWDDQQHYQKIVVALRETMRIMQEIDALIPSWPIE